jgi:hypothetical protein
MPHLPVTRGPWLPALLMCALQGCALDPAGIGMSMVQAGSTYEEPTAQDYVGSMKTEYGKFDCKELSAMYASTAERRARPARDVFEQAADMAMAQLISERGCPTTATAVATTPAAALTSSTAKTQQPTVPVAIPEPTIASGWGSISPTSGLPQTSLAQWIAFETPDKYQGRSCDYLRQASMRSEEMMTHATPEARALGAAQKAAITPVLNEQVCPALDTSGRGRLGLVISDLDPIKAARLGMPLKGTSIERVAPGGNAHKAGLQPADVVVSLNTLPTHDEIDFLLALGKAPIGSSVQLKVWRNGSFIDVPVLVGAAQ